MNLKDKYKTDFDSLINRGVDLQYGLLNELKDLYEEAFGKLNDEERKKFVGKSFRDKYNAWYSESLVLVKQLLPDRLEDFVMQYKHPKRKELTYSTYTISDYLQGVVVKDGYGNIKIDGRAIVEKFKQQFLILDSLRNRFTSSLYDIRQLVQADMMDSELDSAKLLLKNGFVRAAGAICGVILEKHFVEVCKSHSLSVKKKNPGINDFNQVLKDNSIIDTSTWRHIGYLGDLRNLCDHGKEQEPSKEKVDDLIDGTEKVIKTVF